MKKFLWLGMIALVALMGCSLMSRDFYRTAEDFPENGKGMLALVLDGSEIPTKTIAPDGLSMDILSYNIIGKLNGTEEFNRIVNVPIPGGVFTENGLVPSDQWSVEVTAYNDYGGSGVAIGFGSAGFIIYLNTITDRTVEVSPYSGDGALSLTLPWPADAVVNPRIVATLTDVEAGTFDDFDSDLGTGFAISYDVEDGGVYYDQGQYTKNPIPAGYHTLVIQLFGDKSPTDSTEVKVWGDAVSIRIVIATPPQPTSYTWPPIDATGGVGVEVDPDLKNPIDIAISGIQVNGTATAISATADLEDTQLPTNGTVTYDYDWYLDGVWITSHDSSSSDVDSLVNESVPAISEGSHNLSVIATVYVDGAVHSVSSQTASLTSPTPGNGGQLDVTAISTTSVTLAWTKATDAESDPATLEYLAYYSTNSSLDTVAEIEANGTADPDGYQTDIATKVINPTTALDPTTTYYFNVIVRDESGMKAAYAKASDTTP